MDADQAFGLGFIAASIAWATLVISILSLTVDRQ